MALGNLSIRVSADIGDYTSGMDTAARVARERMGQSSGAVNDFRSAMIAASVAMQQAAAAMSGSMQAANDSIVNSSKASSDAISGIVQSANDADFSGLGDGIKEAVSDGLDGADKATRTWGDTIGEHIQYALGKAFDYVKSAAETALAVRAAALFSAQLGGIVASLAKAYTWFVAIKEAASFAVGLVTGDSYKSEDIEALIKVNDQVKDLQSSLSLSAQEASTLNNALSMLNVPEDTYVTVFQKAADAVHSNTEELDRLGVVYRNADGSLRPLDQTLQSAKATLDQYTEGWDRNQAAAAIGMGTYEQIGKALEVTSEKLQQSREELIQYHLGIGPESQAAVKRYEEAMTAFDHANELTKQGFQRAWADAIMPMLTDLAEFFTDGWPFAVNAFRYAIATAVSLLYGLKEAAYIVAESVIASATAIGSVMDGVGGALIKALKGDLSGAKDELVRGWEDAKARLALAGDNMFEQTRRNVAAIKLAWAFDDRSDGPAKPKPGKNWVAAPDDEEDDSSSSGSKRQDPFLAAMNESGRSLAGIQYAIQHFDEFSGKVKESKAAMAEFDVTMGRFADEQRKADDLSPLTDKQKAGYIELGRLIDAGIEKERQLGVLRKLDKDTANWSYGNQQEIVARQQDVEWIGRSAIEIEKLTAARQIDQRAAQMIHQTEVELGQKGLRIRQDQIDAIQNEAGRTSAAVMELIQQSYDKQRTAAFGLRSSLQELYADTGNAAASVRNTVTNAFRGMEDAFVKFVQTGKLSFADLANSIIADLTRMVFRQIAFNALASWMTPSAAGSSSTYSLSTGADWQGVKLNPGAGLTYGGARAAGGPVNAGSFYQVNENGPELLNVSGRTYLMMGSQSGNVTPMGGSASAGGGGTQVSVVVNNNAGRDTQATASSRTDAMGNTVIDVLVEKVEAGMMGRVSRGAGMAPLLERRYGLNPAAGAIR